MIIGLDREHHAFLDAGAFARLADMHIVRILVQVPADAMREKVSHDAEAVRFGRTTYIWCTIEFQSACPYARDNGRNEEEWGMENIRLHPIRDAQEAMVDRGAKANSPGIDGTGEKAGTSAVAVRIQREWRRILRTCPQATRECERTTWIYRPVHEETGDSHTPHKGI